MFLVMKMVVFLSVIKWMRIMIILHAQKKFVFFFTDFKYCWIFFTSLRVNRFFIVQCSSSLCLMFFFFFRQIDLSDWSFESIYKLMKKNFCKSSNYLISITLNQYFLWKNFLLDNNVPIKINFEQHIIPRSFLCC